jgi:hypothetical protein
MEVLEQIRLRLKSELGNNTDEAILELEKELRKDSKLYTEFLICKNKHNSITAEHHRGTISDTERGLKHSKLLDALLGLIDRLGTNDLTAFGNSAVTEPSFGFSQAEDEGRKSYTRLVKLLLNKLFGTTAREITTSLLLVAALIFVTVVQPQLTERRIKERIAQGNLALRTTEAATPPLPTNSYSPSDFEIIERTTTVDFRSWKKVPLQFIKTDRIEPMIWRQLLKIEKKGDSKTFVATHVTDGYTIDFACISDGCIKRPPVPLIPKDGAAKYTKYELEFDVSKYVLNQQFEIEYQAVYWNSNQKDQSDSMAVIARNPTKRLIFEIYFSESMQNDINFRYAEEPDNLNYHKFAAPIYTLENNHLRWEIDNPSLNIYYGVQWKWKTQTPSATQLGTVSRRLS